MTGVVPPMGHWDCNGGECWRFLTGPAQAQGVGGGKKTM